VNANEYADYSWNLDVPFQFTSTALKVRVFEMYFEGLALDSNTILWK